MPPVLTLLPHRQMVSAGPLSHRPHAPAHPNPDLSPAPFRSRHPSLSTHPATVIGFVLVKWMRGVGPADAKRFGPLHSPRQTRQPSVLVKRVHGGIVFRWPLSAPQAPDVGRSMLPVLVKRLPGHCPTETMAAGLVTDFGSTVAGVLWQAVKTVLKRMPSRLCMQPWHAACPPGVGAGLNESEVCRG